MHRHRAASQGLGWRMCCTCASGAQSMTTSWVAASWETIPKLTDWALLYSLIVLGRLPSLGETKTIDLICAVAVGMGTCRHGKRHALHRNTLESKVSRCVRRVRVHAGACQGTSKKLIVVWKVDVSVPAEFKM